MCVISWGYPPQTRTQRTFREKSFGISKALAEMKLCIRCEVLWLTFLSRKVSAVPTYFDKIKKHGIAVLFCMVVISWGYPPQTRTQRTFREKSFGISKALAKVNWCIRCKVLWHTFLRKKGVYILREQ